MNQSAEHTIQKIRQGWYTILIDGYVIGETRVQRDGAWNVTIRTGPADDDFRTMSMDFRKREGAIRQIVASAYQVHNADQTNGEVQ